MITEDYVSFEVAKLLKEKGFKGDCIMNYIDNELMNVYDYDYPSMYELENTGNDVVDAPTLQMVIKWLREVHNIHIDINTNWAFKDDFIVVGYMFSTHSIINSWYQNLVNYSIYEDACEAAIKYCLKNLI